MGKAMETEIVNDPAITCSQPNDPLARHSAVYQVLVTLHSQIKVATPVIPKTTEKQINVSHGKKC